MALYKNHFVKWITKWGGIMVVNHIVNECVRMIKDHALTEKQVKEVSYLLFEISETILEDINGK